MNEINLHCPINRLGYGQVGSYITYELSKLTRVNLLPIGHIEYSNSKLDGAVNTAIQNVETASLFSPPTVKIWHQNQLFDRFASGKYYAWPIFELNTFTKQELSSLRCPRELIVCSKWAKDVVESHIKSTLTHIIPLGVDKDIFKPGPIIHTKPYKFFNIGKWEKRKGHDVLLECFNEAFEKTDNVELHMMCHNPFIQDLNVKWAQAYKNSKLGDKIYVHGPKNSHEEVAEFINSCNCGVFPSRAEGWNLELLESMSCQKPVITTNYSAHTEFCNSTNSYLIDISDRELAIDNIWFHGQGEWAHIGNKQKKQLIEYMRYCYKNQPINEMGNIHEFTWANSAKKLLEILNADL